MTDLNNQRSMADVARERIAPSIKQALDVVPDATLALNIVLGAFAVEAGSRGVSNDAIAGTLVEEAAKWTDYIVDVAEEVADQEEDEDDT